MTQTETKTQPLHSLCIDFKQDIVDGPFGSELKREDYRQEGTPVLKIQNVKPFFIELKKMDYITPSKFEYLKRHSYKNGDIIMTKLGDPLGVSAIVEDLDEGVIVADLVRIRAQKINTKYLCYHLNSPTTNEFINSMQKGTTRPRVTLSVVRDLPIYVPSDTEQIRIVTLLDEAFADIATAKANAEKNLQNARKLFETHLRTVLSTRTSDGMDTTLQKCCDQIFAGGDVPKDRVSIERTAVYPVPIFSNGAKDDGLYGFTDTARVTKPSVTVSARGTLGFSAIRNEPFLPVVRLIVLTPNENLIDLCFLHYTVLGMDFENTGTSIPQLTVPNFKDLSIYLPPLAKQKELVLALDSIRDELQNLESIYRQKLTALDDLKKSLLHQAFSGFL